MTHQCGSFTLEWSRELGLITQANIHAVILCHISTARIDSNLFYLLLVTLPLQGSIVISITSMYAVAIVLSHKTHLFDVDQNPLVWCWPDSCPLMFSSDNKVRKVNTSWNDLRYNLFFFGGGGMLDKLQKQQRVKMAPVCFRCTMELFAHWWHLDNGKYL